MAGILPVIQKPVLWERLHMCHTATGANHDRPLHCDDVPLIASKYVKCLGETAIRRIVDAITDNHVPQPAVLIAILEMADRAKHKDRGIYPWPMMPFSALDLDTLERVQTNEMAAFHTVFESMALAERNMGLVNDVLASELGIQLRLVCDCGCISDGFEVNILESAAYKQVNHLRSLAEAAGTKVIRVPTFTDAAWTSRSLDMGPREIASYERMWSMLSSLPARSLDFAAAAKGIAYLRDLKREPVAA